MERRRNWTRHAAGQGAMSVVVPLAVYAMLVCLRMPEIIIKGRFWAEEGRPFFEHAWAMPPSAALFSSFGGYLNLVANAAGLAARWLVPLVWAPYVTIARGLAFQLCPPLLLLTARDLWLRATHVRLAAMLLLLLVPVSDEVWLQTLHCQFELLLCCCIILVLDVAPGWPAALRLGLLALAPLCGIVVIVLVPFFLARAVVDRSVRRAVQGLTLGAGALVQMLLFFHAVPGRGYALHPVLLLCAFSIRHLALPFLGVAATNEVARSVRAMLQVSQLPLVAIILPVLVAVCLLAASLWQRRPGPAFWLLSAAGLVAVVSYTGAIGGTAIMLDDVRGGGRYVIVPQSLFYLAVLALLTGASGWTRRVGWAVVVWLLGMGAYAYVQPTSGASDGPAWRDEVAVWRADPTHLLQVWPPGWTVRLDPLHRALPGGG